MASLLGRIPVAILIAAVVMVGLGAAVAGGADEPPSIVVAEPGDGERGAYNVTLTGAWDQDFAGTGEPDWQTPWTAIEFGWSQSRAMDAEGRVRSVAALTLAETGWRFHVIPERHWAPETKTSRDIYSIDTAGHLMAEHVVDWSREAETISPGVPVQTRPGSTHVINWIDHAPLADDCFLSGQFAGSRLTRGGSVEVVRTCMMPSLPGAYGHTPFWMLHAGDRLQVRGVEHLGGAAAMRIDVEDQHALHVKDLMTSTWWVPGISVPVRMAMSWMDGDERHVQFDLVGYEGGGPFVGAPASAPAAVPALEILHPWGIDTGAHEVRFPADRAYARMLEEPQAAKFLGQQGFVAGAARSELEIAGMMVRDWNFVLEREGEVREARVSETIPVGLDDLPEPLRSQFAETEVTMGESDRPPQFCGWTSENMPTRAPSLDGAIKRWRAHGGQGEANVWGHGLGCDREGKPTVMVAVGEARTTHLLQERSPENLGSTSFESRADLITFDSAGRVSRHIVGHAGEHPLAVPVTVDEQSATPLAVPAGDAWLSPTQAASVGAFGILVGLLYWGWPSVKAAPLALFSRLRKPDLLGHPQRSALHDLISSRPGIHCNEIQRTLGLANGTVRHHLQIMVRAELLVERRNGRYTCYFVRGQYGRAQMALAAAVKSDGAKAVVAALQQAPGTTAKDVVVATGLSPGTVAHHVKRMQEHGVVEAQRHGRQVRLHVTA